MSKVRKSVLLSSELALWLTEFARLTGASESAIIAIAIKQMKDKEYK